MGVKQGTLHSQIMGPQTDNPDGITPSADDESALWNLTINSNSVFVELYEQRLWEIYHSFGTGATAAVIDPNRTGLAGNPALYFRDSFPAFYTHTFSKVIAAPETYFLLLHQPFQMLDDHRSEPSGPDHS